MQGKDLGAVFSPGKNSSKSLGRVLPAPRRERFGWNCSRRLLGVTMIINDDHLFHLRKL